MVKSGVRAEGKSDKTRKELKAEGRTFDPPFSEHITYNVKITYITPDMRRPKQKKYEKDLESGILYKKETEEYKDIHKKDRISTEYVEISTEEYAEIVSELGVERGDKKGEIGTPFKDRTSPVAKANSDESVEDVEVEIIRLSDGNQYYLGTDGKVYDMETSEELGNISSFDGQASSEAEESDSEVEVEIIYIGDEQYYLGDNGVIYDIDSGLKMTREEILKDSPWIERNIGGVAYWQSETDGSLYNKLTGVEEDFDVVSAKYFKSINAVRTPKIDLIVPYGEPNPIEYWMDEEGYLYDENELTRIGLREDLEEDEDEDEAEAEDDADDEDDGEFDEFEEGDADYFASESYRVDLMWYEGKPDWIRDTLKQIATGSGDKEDWTDFKKEKWTTDLKKLLPPSDRRSGFVDNDDYEDEVEKREKEKQKKEDEEKEKELRLWESKAEERMAFQISEYNRHEKNKEEGRDASDDGDDVWSDVDDESNLELGVSVEDTDWTLWSGEDAQELLDDWDDYKSQLPSDEHSKFLKKLKEIISEDAEIDAVVDANNEAMDIINEMAGLIRSDMSRILETLKILEDKKSNISSKTFKMGVKFNVKEIIRLKKEKAAAAAAAAAELKK